MTQTIPHWIDNKPFAGSGDNTAPVTNPATGAVTGHVALATVEDARTVIDAALSACARQEITAQEAKRLYGHIATLQNAEVRLKAVVVKEK